jgi:tRNA (uracil-5-)-methyltransferase TRM9
VTRGSKKDGANGGDGASEDKVFNRYYHLYARGELERDITSAGGAVEDSGYEKDNWWAIATRESTVPP